MIPLVAHVTWFFVGALCNVFPPYSGTAGSLSSARYRFVAARPVDRAFPVEQRCHEGDNEFDFFFTVPSTISYDLILFSFNEAP